jgi:hypothetical protein
LQQFDAKYHYAFGLGEPVIRHMLWRFKEAHEKHKLADNVPADANGASEAERRLPMAH